MKVPYHYNEELLENLICQQKHMAFDEELSFDWNLGVDISKPLVPLDKNNIAFHNVTKEQRLVISQYMGLVMAATFSELEIAMQRLKDICWTPYMHRYSVNPEMIELGEEFFDEEAKHARVFQRYIDLFAKELGVEPETLKNLLPRVNQKVIDKILAANAGLSGSSFWWIVATVEEESQLIFRIMKKHKKHLDPLYYQLHQKHFEEEARHAPYAFIMLDMINESHVSLREQLVRKLDVIISETTKTLWMVFELAKIKNVKHLKNHHPFFKTLDELLPKLKEQSLTKMLYSFVKETPYISAFINPLYHPNVKKKMQKRKVFKLPVPEPEMLEVYWD